MQIRVLLLRLRRAVPNETLLWSTFRAVAPWLQSDSRAVPERFHMENRSGAVVEQLHGGFSAVLKEHDSCKIISCFRSILEPFQSSFAKVAN